MEGRKKRRERANEHKKGARGVTTSSRDSESEAERLEHHQRGTRPLGSRTDPRERIANKQCRNAEPPRFGLRGNERCWRTLSRGVRGMGRSQSSDHEREHEHPDVSPSSLANDDHHHFESSLPQPANDVESSPGQPENDVESSPGQPENDVASPRKPESDVESYHLHRRDLASSGQDEKFLLNTFCSALNVHAPEFMPLGHLSRSCGNFSSNPHPSTFVGRRSDPMTSDREPPHKPDCHQPGSENSSEGHRLRLRFLRGRRSRNSRAEVGAGLHSQSKASVQQPDTSGHGGRGFNVNALNQVDANVNHPHDREPPHKPDCHQPGSENSSEGHRLRFRFLHGRRSRNSRAEVGTGLHSQSKASVQQPDTSGHRGRGFEVNALNQVDANVKHPHGANQSTHRKRYNPHVQQTSPRHHHDSSVRSHVLHEQEKASRRKTRDAKERSKAELNLTDVHRQLTIGFPHKHAADQRTGCGMPEETDKHDSTHLLPSRVRSLLSGKHEGSDRIPSKTSRSSPVLRINPIPSHAGSTPSDRRDGRYPIPSHPRPPLPSAQLDDGIDPIPSDQKFTRSDKHDGLPLIPSDPWPPQPPAQLDDGTDPIPSNQLLTRSDKHDGLPLFLSHPWPPLLSAQLDDGIDPTPSNQKLTRSDKHDGLPLIPSHPWSSPENRSALLFRGRVESPLENIVVRFCQHRRAQPTTRKTSGAETFHSDGSFLCWGMTQENAAMIRVDETKRRIITRTPEELWCLYMGDCRNATSMDLPRSGQFLADIGVRLDSKAMLVLAWKFEVTVKGRFKKSKFPHGFRQLGCDANIQALRNRCLSLDEEFDRAIHPLNKTSDDSLDQFHFYVRIHNSSQGAVFRGFYEFVFRLCASVPDRRLGIHSGHASLEIGDAVYLWDTIMPQRFRHVVDRWLQFWQEEPPSSEVSGEEWNRFLHFCEYYLTFCLEDAVAAYGQPRFAEYIERRPISAVAADGPGNIGNVV